MYNNFLLNYIVNIKCLLDISCFPGVNVISIGGDPMSDCSHEEADSRMLVHPIDSLDHGFTRIQVRTVDSDVVVILIGQFHKLLSRCPDLVLWVAFGMGKNFTYYKVNDICSELGYVRPGVYQCSTA